MSAGVTNYAAVLQAWLQDHMRYPRRAKLRNMQGTATLWLSIDADGHVLGFRIQQSSGHSLLDSEVEALVHRADPMPAAAGGDAGLVDRVRRSRPVRAALGWRTRSLTQQGGG
jgi:TonB family protein